MMSCPGDLAFDTTRCQCNWPANMNCPTFDENCVSQGVLYTALRADPTPCSHYLVGGFRLPCGAGTLFDVNMCRCNHAHLVTCIPLRSPAIAPIGPNPDITAADLTAVTEPAATTTAPAPSTAAPATTTAAPATTTAAPVVNTAAPVVTTAAPAPPTTASAAAGPAVIPVSAPVAVSEVPVNTTVVAETPVLLSEVLADTTGTGTNATVVPEIPVVPEVPVVTEVVQPTSTMSLPEPAVAAALPSATMPPVTTMPPATMPPATTFPTTTFPADLLMGAVPVDPLP